MRLVASNLEFANMKFLQRLNYIRLGKNISFVAFIVSCMFWSFAYGIVVQEFRVFPYDIIRNAKKGASEVHNIVTGKLPWYYRNTTRNTTVIVHRPDAYSEGLNLMTGLTKDGEPEAKVVGRDGKVINRWLVNHHLPKKNIMRGRPTTHIHGIALLKNGDLVLNLERTELVRLDLCGNIVWRLPYKTHHAVHIDEGENIWAAGEKPIQHRSPALPNYRPPFREFTLLKVSPEGTILSEISISNLLIKNGLQGLLYLSATDNRSTEVSGDTLHLNDVEFYPSHLQRGFFKPNDVMISLRNINAIAVFDLDTQKIKYLNIGKVVRQHDPDFIDEDSISVFDNNNIAPESQGPQSRIVVFSLNRDQGQVIYTGSEKQPFYTDIMGKHQWLPNGNILITESTKGRAFEIHPKDGLVWEYFNIVKPGRLALLDEAQRLPSFFNTSFFEEGRRNCGKLKNPNLHSRRGK
jgi:hypothetical protein